MKSLLEKMFRNKHTTLAAVAGFVLQAIPIFWPDLKAKCDELFKLAIVYGFAMAGDAGGNDKTDKPARSRAPLLLGIGALAIVTISGCATHPRAAAYQSLADLRAVVDRAESVYGDACVAGRVTPADQAKLDQKIREFHAAFALAVRAARADYSTPASPDLDRLAEALVKLIYTFAKEPAP